MKGYDIYKDSGVEWIGEIPEHWSLTKLKFLGEAFGGLIYSPNDLVDNSDQGKLVLRSSNIQNGKLDLNDNVYVNLEISDKLTLKKGDILICSRNGSKHLIGKNICIDEQMEGNTFGAFMMIFRSKEWKFLSQYFNSPIFTSQSSLFLSSTINQLTSGTLKDFFIAVPNSDDEKTNIATFLDYKTALIDETIEKKKRLIALLKEKRQAVINEAVTKGLNPDAPLKSSGVEWLGEIPEHWKVIKLKQIADAFGRIGYRGYTTSDIVGEDEGAITISPSNMKGNYMAFKNCTYISWEKYEESPEIKIYNNDILIVKTGSTYGKIGIVKNLDKKATINPQVLALKNIIINPDYLFNLLRTNYIQYQVETNVIGSTIPTISQTKILNFSLPLPPNEEIETIMLFIQKQMDIIDKTQKLIEKAIEKLQSYRQSLISEAVTGKIDVRDWQLYKN